MATGLEIKHVYELHLVRKLFWLFFVVVLALSVWFGYKYFESGDLPPFVSARSLSANDEVEQTEVSPESLREHAVGPREPRYVTIPELGGKQYRSFSADLDNTNQLALQKNINDISWYKNSSTPGIGYGVVIISGHGLGTQGAGPFENASQLKTGDEIHIQTGSGKVVQYKISEVKVLPVQDALTTGTKLLTASADEDKEGLNIIAPAGKWIPKYKQFDSRIIIRAIATQ
tara:strand:+ start:134 stop:823 length:690 start_codon:yes stop_codon:yes gene_type:complete